MLQHRIRRPSLYGIRKTPVRGRTPLSDQASNLGLPRALNRSPDRGYHTGLWLENS